MQLTVRMMLSTSEIDAEKFSQFIRVLRLRLGQGIVQFYSTYDYPSSEHFTHFEYTLHKPQNILTPLQRDTLDRLVEKRYIESYIITAMEPELNVEIVVQHS